MNDFEFNGYPQSIYYGNFTPPDQPRPSSVMMGPYGQNHTSEDAQLIGMVPSLPAKDLRSFSYNPDFFSPPTLDIPGQVQHLDPNYITPGLLPTRMNPPNCLAPWVTPTTFQSSDYLAHSPAWPMNGVLNCQYPPCDQHVPTQMPELGYESTSPASERVDCSRMEVSESPLPKIEQEDSNGSAYQAASVEDDSDNVDPCYAELLRQCLLEAPNYTMSLRDLYTWVAEHSPKAKDPSSTGWKNSVRHNLSMNQGFEKVIDTSAASSGQGKSRSFWRLSEEAVTRGIQSTTRYRKGDGKRKSQRSNHHGTPDDKRVRSGAKGGQATRRLAHRRAAAAARGTWASSSRQQSQLNSPHSSHTNPAPVTSPASPITNFPVEVSSPYWASMPDIQDPIPYAAPAAESDIMDNGVHSYYMMPAVTGYFHQPLQWDHPVPNMNVKVESGWLEGQPDIDSGNPNF